MLPESKRLKTKDYRCSEIPGGVWITVLISRNYNPEQFSRCPHRHHVRQVHPKRGVGRGEGSRTIHRRHTNIPLNMLDFRLSFCRLIAQPGSVLKRLLKWFCFQI